MLRTESGSYVFNVSDAQARMKDSYTANNVPRAPDKAAEGLPSWAGLGAEISGGDISFVGATVDRLAHVMGGNLSVVLGGGGIRAPVRTR